MRAVGPRCPCWFLVRRRPRNYPGRLEPTALMERCRLLGPPPRDAFPEVYLVPSLGGRVLLTELTKHDLTASSRKGYLSSEEEHSGPAHSCPIYSRSIIMFHSTLSLIHISEPTRLRRISYAVFCSQKKKPYRTTGRRTHRIPPRPKPTHHTPTHT